MMENIGIDLHTHTNYSDGDLSPKELIHKAIENNIGIIAITDHDSVLGLKSIDYSSFDSKSIRVIPGIELTAKVDRGQMHILGLNIDKDNTVLNNKLIELNKNSKKNFLLLVENLKNDYNIFLDESDINYLLKLDKNLGRPDIAKLLIKNNYVNSVREAFNKYLIGSYEKIRKYRKTITYLECLKLILESGGVPVLAHPKSLKLSNDELVDLLKIMKENGLVGIEVYHSIHNNYDTKLYLEIASNLGLLVSGGSDYHGSLTKPNIELGRINGEDIKVKKLSVLNSFK